MTRDEIMALSGRELDAAIAERVCGWRRFNGLLLSPRGGLFEPRYSTDLNACREAEEKLIEAHVDQYSFALCELVNETYIPGSHEDALAMAMADAATRCRAMLLALEAK